MELHKWIKSINRLLDLHYGLKGPPEVTPVYRVWLYGFVPVRAPPPAPPPPATDFCSRDNFWTPSWISFIFWHNCWPWPIDYLIRFWLIFVVTLTLNFQGRIWNLIYLSQKWFDCHETKSKHIDWTLGLKCDHRATDLGHDLDLDFLRSNMEFAISQPKMARLPPSEKQTYQLNFTTEMWPSVLTLTMALIFEFSRSNVT